MDPLDPLSPQPIPPLAVATRYPFLLKLKFIAYVLILGFTSFKAGTILVSLNSSGFGVGWMIFAMAGYVPFFILVGGIGLYVTHKYKIVISHTKYVTSIVVDIVIVTAVIPLAIATLLGTSLSSWEGFKVYFISKNEVAYEQATTDLHQQAQQDYDYFVNYFKQPRHVQYVIGTYLYLNDGINLSLSGIPYDNLTTEGQKNVNKFLKETYQGKDILFSLRMSRGEFLLHYVPGAREGNSLDAEERSLLDSLPNPRSDDARRVRLGTVKDVSIIGIENIFSESILDDMNNFREPMHRHKVNLNHISPRSGAVYNVGDTVNFSWEQSGFYPSDILSIYMYPNSSDPNSGTQKLRVATATAVSLNKTVLLSDEMMKKIIRRSPNPYQEVTDYNVSIDYESSRYEDLSDNGSVVGMGFAITVNPAKR